MDMSTCRAEERNNDLLHNALNDSFQEKVDRPQDLPVQQERCAGAIIAQHLQTNVAEYRMLTELRQQVIEHSNSFDSSL